MWLEYIDKGNAIPAPLNIIYYAVFFLTWGIKEIVCLIATVCRGCKCKKQQRERGGPTESQTRPKHSGEEIDVEEGDPDQINEEQGKEDQNSGPSCSCICSWCCFPHGCRCRQEGSAPSGHTFTYLCSCICHGCSCFCKPIQANVVREERVQAIRSSVTKYVETYSPDEETELQTSALASSPKPKAGEGFRE